MNANANESTSTPPIMSKKQQRKQQRKQHIAELRKTTQQELLVLTKSNKSTKQQIQIQQELHNYLNDENYIQKVQSKSGRAKAARLGKEIPKHINYRQRQYMNATSTQRPIINYIETLEKEARQLFHPNLIQRSPIPIDLHGDWDSIEDNKQEQEDQTETNTLLISHSNQYLYTFSMELLQHLNQSIVTITTLDLSRNNLFELPNDIKALSSLTSLNISRNLFTEIPICINALPQLIVLNVAKNVLIGSTLNIQHLQELSHLQIINLQYNEKCCKIEQINRLKQMLLPTQQHIEIQMTVLWYEGKIQPYGTYVGDSAGERDATILRSQLEPWGTSALRRRLVGDFGHTSNETDTRSNVMSQLLTCYKNEGLMEDIDLKNIQAKEMTNANTSNTITTTINTAISHRLLIHIQGTPVNPTLCQHLLDEMQTWSKSNQFSGINNERTSIRSSSYTIIHSPESMLHNMGSKKQIKAYKKFKQYEKIWNLAMEALHVHDPNFAARVTGLALTHNFIGSPHIDKQDNGPFYGLSLGNFVDGTGGIQVECSARVVCEINTKNRLGKVDGRYPHWVSQYGSENQNVPCDRYSLIYYKTTGVIDAVCGAIFEILTK